jgi:hypothetical protein
VPSPLYSDATCERIRLARELVEALDVNLAGVAVVIHLKDQLLATRRQFHETLEAIHEALSRNRHLL